MSQMETEQMEAERMQTGNELEVRSAEAADDVKSSVTLFAGVTGVVEAEQLRSLAAAFADSSGGMSGGMPVGLRGTRLVIAYPGSESGRMAIDASVDMLSYPLPTAEGATTPWALTAAAQGALLSVAAEMQPQAIVLLHPDLSVLTPLMLEELAAPVLKREAELVMASYAEGPFDSLLNHSILAPLTRALYGKRVRFPLAPDFALSARLGARLAMSAHSRPGGGMPVLWPTMVAASLDAVVTEAQLGLHHPTPAGDIELSAVIAQLVGSTFAEMEVHAPLWQRVRAAQHPVGRMPAHAVHPSGTDGLTKIDTGSMVNSFLLGSRSLPDVWGMLLPPVSLLDLKRLTLLPAEKFKMPDELWVRIVYDFALGYRQRTINRAHLLGALTPLYLGWVASYLNEAASDTSFDANDRAERLARAFEDGKPYLVRRWRWPDRFNP
jgi:hypothetical protein